MNNNSFKLYLSETQLSRYYFPTITFCFLYSLQVFIRKFTSTIANSAFDGFQVDLFINTFCLIYFSIGVIKLLINISKRRYPSLLSIFYWLLIGIGYFIIFRSDQYFIFYRLFNTNFFLADSILIGSILCFSTYIYVYPNNNFEFAVHLLEDSPDVVTKDNDKLSRSNYAEHIANIINNTKAEKAIAIAITSEWGFGKTTFLRFIESELKIHNKKNRNSQQNLIIHFNPWKFENSDQILSHFFETLENEFEKFDDSVANNIKEYSKKLIQIDDSLYTKFISHIFEIGFGSNKSLSDRYKSLNNSIIRSGRRIVIMMDDLDRLIGEELISVTRLIRNTADFSNTFFIAAFDQNYVLNTISTTRSSFNKENYLQKIFQLEVALPPIRDKVINSLLKEYLQVDAMPDSKKKLFEDVLPTEKDNIFFKSDTIKEIDQLIDNDNLSKGKVKVNWFLDNIRDVKRFTNSFKITYAIIGNETDLYDLLTIELIKYRFPSIYTLIADEEILARSVSGTASWSFSEEKFNKYIQSTKISDLNIESSEVTLVKVVLKELFDSKKINNNRTIVYQSNFHLYFQYQLFNSVSIQEFNISIKSGKKALVDFFAKSNASQKLNELLDYIERIIAYDNKEEFENLAHCLLLHSFNNTYSYNRVVSLLLQERININAYYNGNQNEYCDFLIDLLDNNLYDPSIRAKIAYEFLFLKLKQPSSSTVDESKIKKALINLLDEQISNHSHSKNEHSVYLTYTYNKEAIDSNKNSIMIAMANDMYKEYLRTYNKYFLRTAIVPTLTIYQEKVFTFDPLILQIFKTFEDFEIFLISIDDSEERKLVSSFFSLFKEKGFKHFSLNEKDQQKLNKLKLE